MIHILFSSSAAGTLRELLNARGLREKVVDLSEELDFGPISSDNFVEREEWFNRYVPTDFGKHDWISDSVKRFVERVSQDSDRLIWIAPTSAAEQAGLCWYLARFSGSGVRMVIADYPLEENWQGKAPLSLGELGLEPMGQLLDDCPRVPRDELRFPEERWQILVAEGARLRVVENGLLRSVPENYFDPLLLEQCSTEWQKWHRVVAHTMGAIWDKGQSAASTLMIWRLRILIETGKDRLRWPATAVW